VPRFLTAIRAGTTPVIYGDGEQSRDFTFVENVVRANLAACAAPAQALGEAYNVACGDRITLNELLRILASFAGREVRPRHEPPRKGDVRHSLAGIERAAEKLGFRPEIGVHDGLRRLWDLTAQ
jgi:nucleoside-diphosphate-sugar epimerase